MKSLLTDLDEYAIDTRKVYGGVEVVYSGRGKYYNQPCHEFLSISDDGCCHPIYRLDSGGTEHGQACCP